MPFIPALRADRDPFTALRPRFEPGAPGDSEPDALAAQSGGAVLS